MDTFPSNSTNPSSLVLTKSLLPWLLSLLSDRTFGIRYSGWAIATAIVQCKDGQDIVINEFQSLPGGLWAASLGVILDVKECFAVRSQVLILECFHFRRFLTP